MWKTKIAFLLSGTFLFFFKQKYILLLEMYSFNKSLHFKYLLHSLSYIVFIATGSPQDVKPFWHLASSLGNQISDSCKSTILCIGWSSICSPSFRVFSTNSLTLWTKSLASVFMPTTFAIGHWLWLAYVFSRTISPFWKFLCFLLHLWQDWSNQRNSFHHPTQN